MKRIVVFFTILISFVKATTFEDALIIQKSLGAKKALQHFEELARQNNTKAIHSLALIYLKGEDKIKIDIKKAYQLLLKSSALGNIESTYVLGKVYLSKKSPYHNKIKAYNYFVEAANKGHSRSQTMIGKFFLFGIEIDKDYSKALYYFKLASKQKEYNSNCYIAYMYAAGYGVFPNFGRAHVFAKDEYKKGNKLCKKVWKDYNLHKYPEDKGWKIGDYNRPVK